MLFSRQFCGIASHLRITEIPSMNKSTVALLCLLLCSAGPRPSTAEDFKSSPLDSGFSYAEAYSMSPEKYGPVLSGELIVSKTSLFQDESFPVDIRIYNKGIPEKFFNVYW